jgi:phenylacetate-CoA ligase
VREGRVDLGRFDTLPILTKEIIRAEGPRLRARTLPPGRRAFENKTGGSTGQQLTYWQDSHYWDVNVATKTYHFEVLGKRLGDPELKVWGSERDVSDETANWKRKLQNWVYNRRISVCTRLTPEDIERIIGEINAFRPATVWGYIDGLYTIAEYARRHGRRLHRPVAVLGGGGTLLPPMVEPIREAFGAPVINFYGSREMGDVACECPQTAGLHLSMNSHRVEVLDAQGRSVVEEDGDLVLTSLHNYAMPFIRYRIGDRGRLRGRLTGRLCPCGRQFPLLESVSGRIMEAFVRSDGAVISPLAFVRTVRVLAEPSLIDRLQFVQEDYARIRVRLVTAAGASEEALADRERMIRERIREVMDPSCEVEFERLAEIPPSASGKYLYTVSKVRPLTPGLERFSA